MIATMPFKIYYDTNETDTAEFKAETLDMTIEEFAAEAEDGKAKVYIYVTANGNRQKSEKQCHKTNLLSRYVSDTAINNVVGSVQNPFFYLELKDTPPAKCQRELKEWGELQKQQQDDRKVPVIPSHYTPVLLALAINNMDGWDRITTDRTVSDSTEIRHAAVAYYGLKARKHCQILGTDTKHVLNAHIWPHHNSENMILVDLKPSDVNSPKNILRLHKNIERCFDHKQLTFVQSGNDSFYLKLLDPDFKTTVLVDTNVTFGDIDGYQLHFPNEKRPWRRLLATHSIIALKHARDKGWLPDYELSLEEIDAQERMGYSLDEEAQDRLRMFVRYNSKASS